MIDPGTEPVETEPVKLDATSSIQHLVENVEKVIRGKRRQVELVITCLLAGGHILMEDNPGTGKTVLARTLSEVRRVSMCYSSAYSSLQTCCRWT